VFGLLSRLFERRRQLEDGSVIASLLEMPPPRVGQAWWLHDTEFEADPAWHKGTIVATFEDHFVVELDNDLLRPQSIRFQTEISIPPAVHSSGLVELALKTLYCVPFDKLSANLFENSVRSRAVDTAALRSLGRPAKPGEIDWFLSHSWHDDPATKWAEIKAEAEKFKRCHGRWQVHGIACDNAR